MFPWNVYLYSTLVSLLQHPVLHSMWGHRGPVSGGTLIQFNGTNLDTGNDITVVLSGTSDVDCVFVRFVTDIGHRTLLLYNLHLHYNKCSGIVCITNLVV